MNKVRMGIIRAFILRMPCCGNCLEKLTMASSNWEYRFNGEYRKSEIDPKCLAKSWYSKGGRTQVHPIQSSLLFYVIRFCGVETRSLKMSLCPHFTWPPKFQLVNVSHLIAWSLEEGKESPRSCWTPPLQGCIKVNFDAAVRDNASFASVVARSQDGVMESSLLDLPFGLKLMPPCGQLNIVQIWIIILLSLRMMPFFYLFRNHQCN